MTLFSTRALISSPHSKNTANPPKAFPGPWGTSPAGDTTGRFVTSPWEGLRWEACPSPVSPSLAEAEELVGLDQFLSALMYGE
jgi:hypothetical protein